MQLLGRHRAIHLTPPMLWIFRFMTLAWAVLFPRQRCTAPGVSSKTARRLEAISRKFPLAPSAHLLVAGHEITRSDPRGVAGREPCGHAAGTRWGLSEGRSPRLSPITESGKAAARKEDERAWGGIRVAAIPRRASAASSARASMTAHGISTSVASISAVQASQK